MDREILFRAKRKHSKEWVAGYYVCLNGTKHYDMSVRGEYYG